MRQSKLGSLLATFTPKEWASFMDYVASPFFNKNSELVLIAAWLREKAPHFENTTRIDAWQLIYPDLQPDDRQINYWFSWLFQLAGQFLALNSQKNDPFDSELAVAQQFSERGLDKQFDFQILRARRLLAAQPLRNDAYYQREFNLIDLESAHFSKQSERKTNPHLQAGADALDRFYFSHKLRYACGMLNQQAVVAASFELTFTDEIRQFLDSNQHWLESPAIEVYYRIWRILSNPESAADFQALKTIIVTQHATFPLDERKELYVYALNYCIRQIRNVREEYVAEALQLYESSIENGVLLSNGELLPWHFKNIVRLGLRSGRFNWTEGFILEKSALLNQIYREDALHFSLADLYFYTKRYNEALHHLHQMAFNDIYNTLDAKEMLAKIYFEHGEYNALDSHIHAFRVYLRRNKQVTHDIRQAYLHFLSFLEQATRVNAGARQGFRERISATEPLVAKAWLLEQFGQVVKNT